MSQQPGFTDQDPSCPSCTDPRLEPHKLSVHCEKVMLFERVRDEEQFVFEPERADGRCGPRVSARASRAGRVD